MENASQNDDFITTLSQLYQIFDRLNSECGRHCNKCNDLDCAGYIWLLPEEAEKLLENDVDIIEVNQNTHFINSFEKSDGTIDLTQKYPKCIHQCPNTNKCLIHKNRPLTCHMYPIGPETINGQDMWICHCECEFIRYLISNNAIDDYVLNAKNILRRIDKKLYDEIIQVYKDMNYIMDSTEQINEKYIVIQNM